MDVCMYVCMYVCVYVWMYGWMDGWMDACFPVAMAGIYYYEILATKHPEDIHIHMSADVFL